MSTPALTHGSLLAHPLVIAWRNRLRHNPLLRGLYRHWIARHEYEERFARGLLETIQPGDVVWDIGANIGLYSEKFLEKQASAVVCFEPAPAAVEQLHRKFGRGSPREGRVHIVPVALSSSRGTAIFSAEGSSPTNKIANEHSAPGGRTIEVPVWPGDAARAEFGLPQPQVIKIDVEGYELDVIEGLANVLASSVLRAVFVEVHFALLHERGLDQAPSRIIAALSSRGFRTSWLDPSHLAAVKGI